MTPLTIQQTFDLAFQHHQAGHLRDAEQLYRQILAQQPEHLNALHLLGVLAHQVGRHDVAVDLIGRAVALNPTFTEARSNLGAALKDLGQLDRADAELRQAIALNPNFPEAYSNLGAALKEQGQLDQAIAAYRQAIALKPRFAEAHNNLGNALRDAGQLDQAIAAYRQALTVRSDYPEAHSNLGVTLLDAGQRDQALAAFRQAIALRPNYAEAHCNLGTALKDSGQAEAAIAAYRQAIALKPNYAEAHSNLGNALREAGQLDQAIAAHRQAIALNGNLAEAHYNLANALKDGRHWLDAMAAYRQTIALKPNYAEAHNNLAQILLLRGDWRQGWEEQEWRWRCKGFPTPWRNFSQKQWDGTPLQGRTILLHAEQGMGDTIEFIRYLPLVAQAGGRVLVECQPELHRLLTTLPAEFTFAAQGQPLPNFDVHCPIMSLPKAMATILESIPANMPYLHTAAKDAEMWRTRLADHGPGVKVGLVWAGNPRQSNDRNRSTKLANLAPLAQVALPQASGVRFYSLQKGDAAEQAKTPPVGMDLRDLSNDLTDFADTAALIANLDLVITVDTAVAHLAGAMGKPVWTMLAYVADWRWLLDREDCPWYPTMRLFRQPASGDWAGVVARVSRALSVWIDNRR